jgi:uncharacterized protein
MATRPVVRAFAVTQVSRAIAWARAGGHAVVREAPSRAVWLARPWTTREEAELARFALADLGRRRFGYPRTGPYAGLAVVRVAAGAGWVLDERARRDAAYHSPTTVVALDCTRCGACCRDNDVVLGAGDVQRLAESGQNALRARRLVRYHAGKLRLALAPSGACVFLQGDRSCAVYEARPAACRAFPMGSESCLSARAAAEQATQCAPV